MAPRCSHDIWQWNCRGYRQKRGNLQQFVGSRDPPDVIALQETKGYAPLTGYKQYTAASVENKPNIAILVRRNLPALQHNFDEDLGIEHVLIELIPPKRGGHSLFILNIYSPPSCRAHRFGKLFAKTLQLVEHRSLVILGDFNAAHIEWGYRSSTPKGSDLWNQAQQCRLTLITDHNHPTRLGTSVSIDTTPDLTFTRNVPQAQWSNLGQNLGSDHFILLSRIKAGPAKRIGIKTSLTNWDKLRELRNEHAPTHISSLKEWAATLLEDVAAVTEEVPETAGLEEVDTHLLHLWQARTSIQNRWRKQRLNRKLRLKVAQLDKQIEEYATKLTSQQWYQVCDGMQGQLGMDRTWHLLRYLLEPNACKSAQRERLIQLSHQFQGTNEELFKALETKYFGTYQSRSLAGYEGKVNDTLDAPILEAEVRAAVLQLQTKSAPGEDNVTNKTLRNLDDNSITALTEYMNECWDKGELPSSWKHAKVIFIPKTGKTLSLDNLRPISLTSCLGKLMEHVILNRLREFAEDNNLLPPTLIGFRPKLSTQDAMLRIKHDILDQISPAGTKAILGLDLTKAFDNISHVAILEALQQLGVGAKIDNYVKDFLSSRTANLHLGGLKSDTIRLGSRGTPQGSVLSPFLFNIVMANLPSKLNHIPDLKHSIYADDITLWVNKGNDAHVEETLQ